MDHTISNPSAAAPTGGGADTCGTRLPDELAGRLRACVGPDAALDELDLPDKIKSVSDDPLKLMVVDARRQPRAVVFWAPANVPGRIARDMQRLFEARAALGEELGAVVLQPRETGWIEQRSYAIAPYCKPFADHGVAGHMHRAWLRPRVLRWLVRVTVQTQRPVTQEDELRRAIEYVASLPDLTSSVRTFAGDMGCRLLASAHQPRHVVCHNDLWMGNILQAPHGSPYGFVLIDWGASHTHGYPIYDLLQMAVSLRLRPRALRRELNRHCAALGCEPAHAAGYLTAALGQLGLNREKFPLNRYVAVVENCFHRLRDAGFADAKSRRPASVALPPLRRTNHT